MKGTFSSLLLILDTLNIKLRHPVSILYKHIWVILAQVGQHFPSSAWLSSCCPSSAAAALAQEQGWQGLVCHLNPPVMGIISRAQREELKQPLLHGFLLWELLPALFAL